MSEHTPSFSNPFEASQTEESQEVIEAHLEQQKKALKALPDDASETDKAKLKLSMAEAYIGLNQGSAAWINAREAFNAFLAAHEWEEAVAACDALYQSGQAASMTALGHGVWLAVTFPIDPYLSIQMLSYVIEETPKNADGAAVAAVAAKYIADLRGSEEEYENMEFLTRQQLVNVAEAHSQVKDQAGLDVWMDRLDLRDPAVFLKRLSLVIGAIVGEEWWFDRDKLSAFIPE